MSQKKSQKNQNSFTMSSYSISKEWFIVDAAGQTLGRLASQIAYILRGKHKPTFTPHMDMGDYVIVINAEKIVLTGNKELDKQYHRHTGYFGGIRTLTAAEIRAKHPGRLVEYAVDGMLPRGPLGRECFRHLRVYIGSKHPHVGQMPKPLPPRTASIA